MDGCPPAPQLPPDQPPVLCSFVSVPEPNGVLKVVSAEGPPRPHPDAPPDRPWADAFTAVREKASTTRPAIVRQNTSTVRAAIRRLAWDIGIPLLEISHFQPKPGGSDEFRPHSDRDWAKKRKAFPPVCARKTFQLYKTNTSLSQDAQVRRVTFSNLIYEYSGPSSPGSPLHGPGPLLYPGLGGASLLSHGLAPHCTAASTLSP